MKSKNLFHFLKISFFLFVFMSFEYNGFTQELILPTNDFDIMVGIDNSPTWTGFNLTQDYNYNGKIFIGINPDGPVRDLFGIVTSYGGPDPFIIDTKLSLKSDGGAFFKGNVDILNSLSINRKSNSSKPSKLSFVYDDDNAGTPDPSYIFSINDAEKLILTRLSGTGFEYPAMSFLDNTGSMFVGIGTNNPTQNLDVIGIVKSTGLISGNSTLGNTDITGNLTVSNILTSSNYINGGNYLALNNNVSGQTLKLKTIGDDNWGIEHSSQINLSSGSDFYGMGLRIMDNGSNGFYIRDKTSGNYRMVIRDGKMGIGTSNPEYTLDVAGTINATDILKNGLPLNLWSTSGANIFYNSGYVGINKDNPAYNLDVNGNINAIGFKKNGVDVVSSQWQNNSSDIYFNSGSVGIGTSTPNSNYKLSVSGSIRAKSVFVETGWSDFVFESGYDLKTLKEVEDYIAEYGHLPDIPSKTDVNENGVDLGDISAKLLQKIEELTLYLIEQEKEIGKIKAENLILKEKMLENNSK